MSTKCYLNDWKGLIQKHGARDVQKCENEGPLQVADSARGQNISESKDEYANGVLITVYRKNYWTAGKTSEKEQYTALYIIAQLM